MANESKSAKELKKELEEQRKEELKLYGEELTQFLTDRNIDLDTEVVISGGKIDTRIQIIDRL